MALYDDNIDDEIRETALDLEAEGKITYDACWAYLSGDEDGYVEEMERVAEDVCDGIEVEFLTREEIEDMTKYLEKTFGLPDPLPRTLDEIYGDDEEVSTYEPIYTPPPVKSSGLTTYTPSPTYNPTYEVDAISTAGSLLWGSFKWIVVHASGLAVPYAGYKVVKALATNKDSAIGGAVTAAGIAAVTGIDLDLTDLK